MPKPTIYYHQDKTNNIAVGYRAFCFPVGRSARADVQGVLTSTVLEYDSITGEFETLNSVYKPLTSR